jgi:hypothetical protein
MNAAELEELLIRWSRPSSDDEVEQQERAMRMVTDAIAGSDLANVPKRIYAKGSYANNTNVRLDSDVDIAVDCHDCMYYESHESVSPKAALPAYMGPWTPATWRSAIIDACRQKFGRDVIPQGPSRSTSRGLRVAGPTSMWSRGSITESTSPLPRRDSRMAARSSRHLAIRS